LKSGGDKLINPECLRETPLYRKDMYSELKRIEERGKRMKKERSWARLFGGQGNASRA